MNTENLEQLLEKTRRVYLPEDEGGAPELPSDMVGRVLSCGRAEKWQVLQAWQWTSYAGLATAAGITLMMSVQVEEESVEQGLASDPWLEMPMISEH